MIHKLRIAALSLIFASSMMIPVFAAPALDLDDTQIIQPETEDGDAEPIITEHYTYDPNTFTLTFTNPTPYDRDNAANNISWPTDASIVNNVKTLVLSSGYTYVPVPNENRIPSQIETIELPDGLEIIPDYAFKGFTALSAVELPDTLTSIGIGAFESCSGLTEVQIPDQIHSLPEKCFGQCKNLETVILPDTLTSIEMYAFFECTKLQNITLPQGLTTIGGSAFYDCARLTSIQIPNDITTISDNCFLGCTSLREIILPSGLTTIGKNAFSESGIESIELPESLTTIGSSAFSSCPNLSSLHLPSGLLGDSAVENAFMSMPALERLYIPSDCNIAPADWQNSPRVHVICCEAVEARLKASESFSNISYSLTNQTSFSGTFGEGQSLYWNIDMATETLMISGFGPMPDYTLEAMEPDPNVYPEWYPQRNLVKNIVFSNGITSIGDYAFYDLANLQEVVVPENTATVGKSAFKKCDSLAKITFLSDTLTISDEGLYAKNLREVTILALDSDLTLGTSAIYLNADTTIYGYKKRYTSPAGCIRGYVVTFDDSNEGGSISPEAVPKPMYIRQKPDNEIGTLPSVTTQEGYAFDGWFTEKEGGDIVTTKTTFTENTRLYARWSPAPAPSAPPTTKPSVAPSPQPSPIVTVLPDGTKIEKTTENKPGGYVNTIEKTTKPSGEITLKIVSTSNDKEKKTTVNMTILSSGQLKVASIEVANVTKTKKLTINLDELKALVDQITACQTQSIHPIGLDSMLNSSTLLGSSGELDTMSLGVTQKRGNISIKISAKTPSGSNRYSVTMKQSDLTKNKYVVYRNDKKSNPVMVDSKKNTVKVSPSRDLSLKIDTKGSYQLQNSKDAAKTNKQILKTVVPKKTNVTVTSGQKSNFKLSPKCNTANISKIKYSANNSNVKVTTKGKIQAKTPGTSKVTATVTMKNGTKKKIQMKVNVS